MLSDIVEAATRLVETIVSTFGAPGISLIAFFENLFPPTPSEVLYPLAGKLAYAGKASLPGIIIAGTLGSLAGALIYYTIGHRLGETGARELIAHYGTLRLWRIKMEILSVDEFERGLRLFQRYGSLIVFVARLMPLVHGVVSVPAGVVRMNILTFCLFTTIGAALWITPLTIFGYWLGNNWEEVLDWLDVYENIVLALLGAALVIYVIRRRRNRQASGREKAV